ncbi:hypothetical protein J2S55_001918 [Streptosporangium brasiliense]|uniref:Intein C-terminal splicing domain-containing protein n=2 Tax=Streptosporangiaceae TaxID=2004 RepID=A0ABT9R0D1_9ACTN|nr:hypothetical protein [Streptosporangium brasiliense]
MADGTRKPIEDVKVGDEVLATDPETGKTEAKPVIALITGEDDKNFVQVTVDTDGRKGDKTGLVIATEIHPFWVPALREWVDARDLKAGMWLRTSAGTRVQVTAIKKWTAYQRVHNLTIADLHTYYVFTGSTPVLVHNSYCPPAEIVNNLPEVTAPKPLKPSQVDKAWSDFLGPGPYTNIHPRTGQVDPNRLVSADGRRSIRVGDHEMNSKSTKFHYHMETWDWNSVTNTWTVGNTMQRVPLGVK